MSEARPGPHFHTTRWSLVACAADPTQPDARAAFEMLAQTTWYPLYAFLRRRGHPPEEAEDLVQGLFARLVQKEVLAQIDPERGRFRTFLLTALKFHVSHERDRKGAQKRGGDRVHVPIETEYGERRYAREPATTDTPEILYERAWARALLDRALAQVAAVQTGGSAERARRFELLEPLLWSRTESQAAVAQRLGITETAVKVALHRLRGKVRDALRAEIAATVEDPAAIDDELARLAARLRGED